MVDAITGTSTGWTPPIDDTDDDVRRRAAAARTTKVATAPPEAPDGPGVSGALLMRAAQAQAEAPQPQAAAPRMLLAAAVDAPTTATSDQDTAVQGRMNAFFQSAVPTYHLPAESERTTREVAVATPFRMEGPRTLPDNASDSTKLYFAQQRRVDSNASQLEAIAAKAGISPGSLAAVKVGRGTPEQVHALTQALIDAKKLPPPAGNQSDANRVRQMMGDYGIGFDCAGFTQQAFLSARATTRAQAGLDPRIMTESLSSLSPARFSKVAPEDARAGDVVVLGPPPGDKVGHRAIVFDCHAASPDEIAKYCTSGDGAKLDRRTLTVLSVDSSYGSGTLPSKGGVQRQTWLYDGKQWGTFWPTRVEDDGEVVAEHVRVHDLPYDGSHPLVGIYHYKGDS
jgi:hypothetical protein